MVYSKKSMYKHMRQQPPSRFVKSTLRTVKASHATTPTGEKYKRKFKVGDKAIVGKVKPHLRKKGQRKYQTQSILIKKR
jgi:hypothetical protein